MQWWLVTCWHPLQEGSGWRGGGEPTVPSTFPFVLRMRGVVRFAPSRDKVGLSVYPKALYPFSWGLVVAAAPAVRGVPDRVTAPECTAWEDKKPHRFCKACISSPLRVELSDSNYSPHFPSAEASPHYL